MTETKTSNHASLLISIHRIAVVPISNQKLLFSVGENVETSTKHKTILITGATTGIGLALVREALYNGHVVIGTARESSISRFDNIQLPHRERFHPLVLDIADIESHERIAAAVLSKHGHLDVLINNAGISYRAVVEHMTEQDELRQLRVNYLGPMSLTRSFLPYMREHGRGHIITISSVSGMMAMPTMSSYSASKFAIEGAMEALYYEMKPWNINVTLVQPGFVNSDSFRNVYYPVDIEAKKKVAYANYYSSMSKFIERLMNNAYATPESVARKVIGLLRRKRIPIRLQPTLDAIVFLTLRRFFPRRLYHPFLYRMLPGVKSWRNK